MKFKIIFIITLLWQPLVFADSDKCINALENNNPKIEQETKNSNLKKYPFTNTSYMQDIYWTTVVEHHVVEETELLVGNYVLDMVLRGWASTVKEFIDNVETNDLYRANWLIEQAKILTVPPMLVMPYRYVHILLDVAIYFGIEETVKKILTTLHDININETFAYTKQTLLQRALMMGSSANPNIVKSILDHSDIDINLHHGDRHIVSYAIDAKNLEILNMILYREDLNYTEKDMTNLLLDAVLTDEPEVVLVFIKFDLMTKKIVKNVMQKLIKFDVYQHLDQKIKTLLLSYINTPLI